MVNPTSPKIKLGKTRIKLLPTLSLETNICLSNKAIGTSYEYRINNTGNAQRTYPNRKKERTKSMSEKRFKFKSSKGSQEIYKYMEKVMSGGKHEIVPTLTIYLYPKSQPNLPYFSIEITIRR